MRKYAVQYALGLLLAAWSSPVHAQVPQIGQPAPHFQLERLDGGQIALGDHQGQVVLIFFFGYN